MSKCSKCAGCPYLYNCEYCTLECEYVEDMNYCPDWNNFEGRGMEDDFIYLDGEKVSVDEIHVVDKY